jgi:predicted RNA-binding protein associated with RNAse of E/G family
VNIQEPFRRTDVGYDTQDLELDIIVRADGSWALKDDDVLEQRIAEGRFTSEQIADVRDEARRITRDLEAGNPLVVRRVGGVGARHLVVRPEVPMKGGPKRKDVAVHWRTAHGLHG